MLVIGGSYLEVKAGPSVDRLDFGGFAVDGSGRSGSR